MSPPTHLLPFAARSMTGPQHLPRRRARPLTSPCSTNSGILLVRRDSTRPGNPATHIVMQHRADTRSWSIPGGVRDYGESYRQTALREAWEETSLPRGCTDGPNPLVVVRGEATLMDHGVWKYVTLIADVTRAFEPRRPPGDREGLAVEWIPIDQVGVRGQRAFPLLPEFWLAWGSLRDQVRAMDGPVLAGEDDPPTGDAPLPNPIEYFSGGGEGPKTWQQLDIEQQLEARQAWLTAQENLCLWFIPAGS